MRTAVIGLGRMGLRHLQVALSKRLEIVGLCDSSPAALDNAVAEHGLARSLIYNDFATLLRAAAPECVVIATHAPSHAELVCAAAENGATHILCEKPAAVSLAQCDLMIEVCRRYGARLAVNHQMRYMDQYRLPQRLLSSAEFGGFASATFVTGNIGLAMNGTHYVEAFHYLADEPTVEVAARLVPQSGSNPRGALFRDAAGFIRLTTASGRRMTLECGDDLGHGCQAIYAARHGFVYVDELAGRIRSSVRRSEHRDLPTTRYGMPAEINEGEIAPADALLPTRAVLDDLLADGAYPTGESGRASLAAIVAAHVSSESGGVAVRIDDELPRERRFPWA